MNILCVSKADQKIGDFKERTEAYQQAFGEVYFVSPYNLPKAVDIINKKKIDLIISQDPCVCGVFSSTLSSITKKPYIIQIHGFDYFSGWRGRLTKYLINNCSSVQVVSNKLYLFLRYSYNVRKGVYIMPIPTDVKKIIEGDKLEEEFPNGLFMFCGRLIPSKRPQDFLYAAALVLKDNPKVKFIIVGQGEQDKKLKEIAKTYGIEDSVIFTGFLNHDAIIKLMKICTALVLPSEKEGFGLVCVEAMACGRPVIASDSVGCVGEAVIDGETGLVFHTGDYEHLANKMEKLIYCPELADAFGECGEELAKNKFDVSVIIPQMKKMYEETIKEYNAKKK